MITPSLQLGGSQRFMTYLSKYLNSNRFEISLVVISNNNNSFNIENINIINLNLSRVRFSIFKILNLSKKIKPNIIFTTQFHLNLYIILFKNLFSSNVKFIGRETNILSEKLSNKKKSNIFYAFLIKRYYNFFDKIVCQSTDMFDDLYYYFNIPKTRLSIINNPIDRYFIVDDRKASQQIDFNYDVIAIGSTLGEQKGFERLIDAFFCIKDTKIRLAIIGEGKNRKKLEKKIEYLGMQDRISLVGLKKNINECYKNAKVFALSSYYEGFPNVLLECGLHGIPVVAFNIKGGINDIIIDGLNGIIVPNGDLKQFSDALVKCIYSPFNSEDIKRNILEKYSAEMIIEKYESLFIKINNNL